ncbi:MAG: DNRLRE domain-containing protein, partial [Actinomycetes bacterium]
DSWTDEAATTTTHQNDTEIRVRSSSAGDRHVWTGFALPAVPARCELTQARLRYYNMDPDGGRNIDVYRGDPGAPLWTAATIAWSNEPAYLGPAATNAATTNTPGWQEWVVTDHVLAQYAGGNNGFVLRDRTETSPTAYEQVYYDRQHATYTPTLVLTWG